jgi:hypothetical protein
MRDYLGLEAEDLTNEDVVHKVMCKALDYQRQVGELKAKITIRQEPSSNWRPKLNAQRSALNWVTVIG